MSKNIVIKKYSSEKKQYWNEFVHNSKNATFLILREYMDYHADRFPDYSLMAYKDNTLCAIFPGVLEKTIWKSHPGLTYGGMISGFDMTTKTALDVFDELDKYCLDNKIATIIYKTIPHIYHKSPSEEDRYAMFLRKSETIKSDVINVIDFRTAIQWQKRRSRSFEKAKKHAVSIQKTKDFSAFWEMLIHNLRERHNVEPVHTLHEITLLANTFPNNIALFGAYLPNGEMTAGTVVYYTDCVVHIQYIASNNTGKKIGALDMLFHNLIEDANTRGMRYFDFGASTEKNGNYLNAGLCDFKEGFGARCIVHNEYTWNPTLSCII